MRRIDAAAAAAVGGEMTDADSIETVCCFALDACKRVRDLERANEWCLRVRDIATRFADRQMFSVCRTHYADVLLWHGDWGACRRGITAAVEELGAIRPGREVDPLARLAELRRRQGRTGEAEELSRGWRHTVSTRLWRGCSRSTGVTPRRPSMRPRASSPYRRGRPLRARGRTRLMVRAAVAGGDEAAARAAAEEIGGSPRRPRPRRFAPRPCSPRDGSPPRKATPPPRALIEDAADLFDAAGARYDAALARLDLASALRVVGRDGPAAKAEARAGRRWGSWARRPRRASAGSRRARPRCCGSSPADYRTTTSPASSCSACARWSATWPTSTSRSAPPAHRAGDRDHLGARARSYVASDVSWVPAPMRGPPGAPSLGLDPMRATTSKGGAICPRCREKRRQRRSRWRASRGSYENLEGGYTVGFESYTADADLADSSAGCRTTAASPRWGYVIGGKVAFRTGARGNLRTRRALRAPPAAPARARARSAFRRCRSTSPPSRTP